MRVGVVYADGVGAKKQNLEIAKCIIANTQEVLEADEQRMNY